VGITRLKPLPTIVESAWKVRSSELAARFGFSSWEAWASVGSGEAAVSDDVGKAGKGGLKVLFRDESGNPAGFLWMRGSGTEPVLRIMADLRGRNAEGEAYLLDWQKLSSGRVDDSVGNDSSIM
jgi:phosphoglucomutase